ncbi:glycosyltransferase [Nodularia sp. LEGE 06071]|uniref:glycosyltransferase family 2 protein n=2 Tax=unclassified Nodularia (in: cyanobacteria) TaxID=2656917 RepID=UPI001D118F73
MSNFMPWKVLHIDLSLGVPSLEAEPDYQAIYAVFWWQSIPLGDEEIISAQLPMSAQQLADLAIQAIAPAVGDRLFAHGFKPPLPVVSPNPARDSPVDFQALMALAQPLQQLLDADSPSDQTTVSIVVCTRNRPEELARCLRSLQNLSPPPQQIIVVDNAPNSEATQQLVAQMPDIQYILEPQAGLSIARNTGIRHCTGDIVAFTDDDVVVNPDWIYRLQQKFDSPEVMVVTGLVLPAELKTEAQLMFEKDFGGFGQGYRAKTFDTQFFEDMKSRGVPVWRIGAGANMAIRRQAFELVGNFDERLGAGASGCSEDSELWYRLLAKGWLCCYEPTAVVHHYHRGDLHKLGQQMYQYMQGHVVALLIQFANYGHGGELRRLLIALPWYYTKRSPKEFMRILKSEETTFFMGIWGYLAGIKWYLQNTNNLQITKLP